MKDSKKEKKQATKTNKEKRFRFAAEQLALERKRHLALAQELLKAHQQGAKSFAFAANIKKHLVLANANPEDIGISDEELDDLELELIAQAEEEMESLRRHPDSARLLILTRDMRQAGYSPALLGTTTDELKELNEKAKKHEASKETNPDFFA